LLDFLDVVYEGSTATVKDGTTMPDVKINFAENMLKHGAPESPLRQEEALVSVSEARNDRRWTFGALRYDASRVAAALRKSGVTQEDACGAYLPNIGEAVVAMLGTTSTGSVWDE
jgi:acetoacetyl-CoA synthetase